MSTIVDGKVAENNRVCLFLFENNLFISSITEKNSLERSLSASSRISISHFERMRIFLLSRSSILPGVPTKTWIDWYIRIISSFKKVPPVVTIIFKFSKYFDKFLLIRDT